ncbi:TatD family hydrolase [Vibrio algicola]|uniref:TatD family deoxyribonuclease n=2 Tax=Vibrio TaxID=662 RepID=A0A5Q0TGU4_9VIBR|nr:TatD family hydrolase [Vibrio algicola]
MTDSSCLVDTHCHFDFSAFDDTQHHLDIAQQAGVTKIIIPAIGESNWSKLANLSSQFPSLYYALGLHPYFMAQHGDDAILKLKQSLSCRSSKCVAIGECGLDLRLEEQWLTPEKLDKQYQLFEAQVLLAIEFELPLIIHARKAHDQVVKILRKHQPKKGGVIHAFSGSYQQAMEYIKLGFYIGVGGVISYPRASKTRDVISRLPLSFLLLETDAPDMPLDGFQGENNHPTQLKLVFKALVELRLEN